MSCTLSLVLCVNERVAALRYHSPRAGASREMLDPSLFCLAFKRTTGGIDVIESKADPPTLAYKVEIKDGVLIVCDGISTVELATVRQVTPKSKMIRLVNPTSECTLDSVGFARWEQEFTYEGHRFNWQREVKLTGGSDRGHSLVVIRKPDPPISVADYEPSSDRFPGTIQFRDYNISRLDPAIEDRRGLEIVIVASMASFLLDSSTLSPTQSKPPSPQLATLSLAENEIEVVESSSIDSLVKHCLKLLDQGVFLVKLHARTAGAVTKAVQLAAEVKRARQKATGQELRQYVIEHDNKRPPSSLEIVLSRESLPELEKKPVVPAKIKARR